METLFFVMFLNIPVRVKNDAVGDIKKAEQRVHRYPV